MIPEEKQRRSDAMKAAHARRKAAKLAVNSLTQEQREELQAQGMAIINGAPERTNVVIVQPPAHKIDPTYDLDALAKVDPDVTAGGMGNPLPRIDVAAAIATPITPTVSDTAPISMDEQRAIIPKVFSDSMQHIGVLADGRRVAICEGVRMELLKPTMTSHTVTNPAQRLWNLPGSPAEVNTKGPKE